MRGPNRRISAVPAAGAASAGSPARLGAQAVALAAFALALAPWTVRNAARLGAFVPGTTRMGMALWDAFGPEASGGSDLEGVRWPDGLAGVEGEVERDRFLRKAALREAALRPGRAALLAFPKLGRLWSPVPWAPGYATATYRAVGAAAFVLLMGAACAGGVAFRDRWRAWWPALAPAAYVTLVTTVFAGSLRFRVPTHAALAALAGACYVLLVDRALARWRAHADASAGRDEPPCRNGRANP